MKITDLLNKEYGTDGWRVGRSEISNICAKYEEQDCVVAYLKEKLGVAILFRGEKKFFALIMLRNDLEFGGYDYKMTRIGLKDFFKISDSNEGQTNVVIVDEEAYKKAKRSFVMEEMSKQDSN
jgi:hypothetical protein